MGEKFIAADCPLEDLAEIIKGLKRGEEIKYAVDGSILRGLGKASAPNLPPDKGCWGVTVRCSEGNTEFRVMVFEAIELIALEDEPASVFVDHKRLDFYYHLRGE